LQILPTQIICTSLLVTIILLTSHELLLSMTQMSLSTAKYFAIKP